MLPPPRSYSPRGPPAKMPKKRGRACRRPGRHHYATTTVAAAISSRARAHRASGSHSRSAPRARRRSFSQGKAVAAPTMACCCHIASLRQFWLLCVPAARPQIVSVFVNAASSSRLDFARSDRILPCCSTVSVGSDRMCPVSVDFSLRNPSHQLCDSHSKCDGC